MTPDANEETVDLLIAQVCMLYRSQSHLSLEKLGLYRGQPRLLRLLWDREGQTHSELAASLHVQPATVTKMLQRMEKSGFVKRLPDPHDERISRVCLTRKGRTIRPGVETVWRAQEDKALANLSESERKAFRRLLAKVRGSLLFEHEHGSGGST